MRDIASLLMGFGSNPSAVDVAEVFCPGRLAEHAHLFGLTPGLAADLRTGWDLSTQEGQRECWKHLEREDPYFILGSPMCKAFSVLQSLNKGSENYQVTLKHGLNHLKFCMDVYAWQASRGKKFLHEHPWSATSWKLDFVQKVAAMPGVEVRKGHQCPFGQTSTDATGEGLVAKPTGWMSNCSEVLDAVAVECSNKSKPAAQHHRHVQLIGGRASAAERYPPRLIKAILRGLRRHLQTPAKALAACSAGLATLVGSTASANPPTGAGSTAQTEAGSAAQHEDAERTTPAAGSPAPQTATSRRISLGALDAGMTVEEPEVEVTLDDWCRSEGRDYYDEITGAKLDPQKVFEAHRVEMEFMTTLNVWDVVPVDECWAETGRAPIGTRWIDQNKGDDARPDYRSRLVVQETRTSGTIAAGDIAATFAATPPLEALRLLVSQVMTGDPGSEIVLRFLDISRAHPHCPIHRKVYIRLPQEDPSSGDRAMCGRLNMALYGTRDAGQNFEFKTTDVLEDGGCEQGQFSPCVWFHPLKRLGIYIHGDDYVIAGGRDQSAWLRGHVEQTFIVKDRGVLGPRPDLGDVQEIVVLNRILRFIPEGAPGGECIEYEADPRHADILAAQFGFTDTSKTVATPGVRTKMTESQLEPLKDKDAAFYRSACMRLGYLSMDRPELQYVAKECARGMAVPTEGHYEVLKRAARFVHGHRRMVWRFPRQPERSFLDGFSDSDWAGCLRTRKSTSSSAFRYGQHLISTSSTTQVPISLSSGEAEFYSIVKTASRLIGLQQLLQDLGKPDTKGRLWTDAAAAKGMASRRGVGGVRHLETPTLWAQKAIKDKRFTLHKEKGEDNIADLGTKHVEAQTMWRLINKMGIYAAAGRSKLALKAAL